MMEIILFLGLALGFILGWLHGNESGYVKGSDDGYKYGFERGKKHANGDDSDTYTITVIGDKQCLLHKENTDD